MDVYNTETEYFEKIVQVNRVSKKTAGGNKIGFSVLVVVGDKNGRVGVGLGKAPSVHDAIRKGSAYAKKHLIDVPMVNGTIPHEIFVKRGAAKVLLKPASRGTGVIAGGAVRAVVEAAGIHDVLSKVLGTSNQASNVYAAMKALKLLEKPSEETKKPIQTSSKKEKPLATAKSDKLKKTTAKKKTQRKAKGK